MNKLLTFLIELAIDSSKMEDYINDSEKAFNDAGLSKKEVELLMSGDSDKVVVQLIKIGLIESMDCVFTTSQCRVSPLSSQNIDIE